MKSILQLYLILILTSVSFCKLNINSVQNFNISSLSESKKVYLHSVPDKKNKNELSSVDKAKMVSLVKILLREKGYEVVNYQNLTSKNYIPDIPIISMYSNKQTGSYKTDDTTSTKYNFIGKNYVGTKYVEPGKTRKVQQNYAYMEIRNTVKSDALWVAEYKSSSKHFYKMYAAIISKYIPASSYYKPMVSFYGIGINPDNLDGFNLLSSVGKTITLYRSIKTFTHENKKHVKGDIFLFLQDGIFGGSEFIDKKGNKVWLDKKFLKKLAKIHILKSKYSENIRTLVDYLDFNSEYKQGQTPFIYAAKTGNLDLVEFMLFNGARINKKTMDGFSALMGAAKNGHLETVKYLIENGANYTGKSEFGLTAVDYAAIHKQPEVLEYFSSLGITLNNNNKLEKMNKDLVNLLVSTIISGDIAQAKELINNGAPINLQSNHKAFITPLVAAINAKQDSLVELLLQKGVDTNVPITGNVTAIMTATYIGSSQYIELLSQHGAKLNIQDHDGYTALMYACEEGDMKLVKLLIDLGSDVSLKENQGLTAIDLAEKKGYKFIVNYLSQL